MIRRWATLIVSTVALAGCYHRYTSYSTPSTNEHFLAGGLPCHPESRELYADDAFIWLELQPTGRNESRGRAHYTLMIGLAAPDSAPRSIHIERAVLSLPQAAGDSVLFQLAMPVHRFTRRNPAPDARSHSSCAAAATIAYASVVADSAISLPTVAGVVINLDLTLTVAGPRGDVRRTQRVQFRSSRRKVFTPFV